MTVRLQALVKGLEFVIIGEDTNPPSYLYRIQDVNLPF